MKKFVFILLITHCSLLIVNAQLPTQEWVRRFSDTSSVSWQSTSIKFDSLGFIYVLARTLNEFGFIKYDSNGNLLVHAFHWPGGYPTGGGTLFDVTPNGDVYVTGGVESGFFGWIYTVKFNTNGVFQWGKLYNIDNDDIAKDVKVDKTGNVVVIGGSLVSSSNYALIIKYNQAGDTLWTKHFNNGQNEAILDKLTLDNTDNIYLTGYVGLPGKCLIMKYSPTGNLDWFTTFANDTNRSHIGQGIALDLTGNIYVTATGTVAFSGLNDYLLKMTNSGTILWSRVFTGIVSGQGRNSGSPKGPLISSDGNFIYFSTMTENGTGGGGYSIATVKYNSAGDSQWVKVYNGGGVPATANRIGNIKLDRFDNVYICGSGYFQTTGDDFVTVKYTPAGVQQWTAVYTGVITNGGDGASDLLMDTSLKVYVTGTSRKAINNGTVAVTIKYNQPIGISPSSSQLPVQFSLYQNYPNPFNASTKFKFQVAKLSMVKISVFDVLGSEVETIVNIQLRPGTYEFTIDAANYTSGVYFYRLIADNFIQTNKLIVIK